MCTKTVYIDFDAQRNRQYWFPVQKLKLSFQHVIGTDISKAQIDNAPQLDNVSFRVAPGKYLGVLVKQFSKFIPPHPLRRKKELYMRVFALPLF